MLGGLRLHGVELAAQAARGGPLALELARDPLVHALAAAASASSPLASPDCVASSSRSRAISARSALTVRSVSSRAASSSARSRSVSCASAVIVLSASSRAVASFSRTSVVAARSAASRSSASTFARLNLLARRGQLLVADGEVRGQALELAGEPLALLLGGGERLARLGQLGLHPHAVGAQRLASFSRSASAASASSRRLSELGVALGERRLDRLAAQRAPRAAARATDRPRRGAPPARRREVDDEAAADLEHDAR